MKTLFKWTLMTVLGWGLFFALPEAKAQPGYSNNYPSASYQDFYDGLAPYGQWIQDQQYGYVWLPDAGPDFRPYYTNGYWAMTEYGNTWVSNYDWGWAPFHYGRWTYDSYYGWLWIPDTEWGPAWVNWRGNNDYYGWAPLGPGGISIAINAIPMDWWIFLSPNYFYNTHFQNYYGGYRNTRNIYYNTTIINNTYYDRGYGRTYYCGPNADDYRRRTGRRPTVYTVTDNRRSGGTSVRGNRISMYRPAINNVNNAAPARVAPIDRSLSRKPQPFNNNNNPAGRQQVLQQSRTSQLQGVPQKGNIQPQNRDVQVQQPGQQRAQQQQVQQGVRQQQGQQQAQQQQVQQQRDQQRAQQQQMQLQQDQQRAQQQQVQQQRDQQRAQQQQMQLQQDQQRAQQQQMQQQRDQQRAQQQQMQLQQQQQRAQQQQMQQQQEQQRAQQQQMQQQRDQQRAQQQQMQQQQEQQRAQQQQMQQSKEQRMQQMQQRNDQPQQQQRGGFEGRR